MTALCKQVADDKRFQTFILIVIVLNAVLMGFETSPELMASYSGLLDGLQNAILAVFVAELLIRLLAYFPRVDRFFREGWNVFDFLVVAACFLPEIGPFATIARVARVLRVARLFSFSTELRLIIDTMIRAIPSMGHVVLMMSVLLYVYGVIGYHLFHDLDPENFGNLGSAVWSMFHTLTFENWVALQKPLVEKRPWSWVFFASFILLAVFVGLNMFIAVIMNNLEETRAEHAAQKQAEAHPPGKDRFADLVDQYHRLKLHLAEFEATLEALAAARTEAGPGAGTRP